MELKEGNQFSSSEGFWAFSIVGFVVLLLITFYVFESFSCGDGTHIGKCSSTMPFFCENGRLVEKPIVCGCPDEMILNGNSCIYKYNENPKTISLDYYLYEKKSINFTVYDGFYDYTTSLTKVIENEEKISIKKFKLKVINDETQRQMLMPLVMEIRNSAQDKEEQAKIAISLVQNIPYVFSNKKYNFFGTELNHSRYPYEVLYENAGICGEKSELLAFLLKELGFSVAIFEFPDDDHEAVGIKCSPLRDYHDTGYCFIETTGIINNRETYLGATRTFSTEPEVIPISEGKSIGFLF